MYRKKLLSLLLSLAMAATMAFPAMAAEVTVGPDELQNAILDASPNDIIHLEAGTYADAFVIDKALTLVGPETGEAVFQFVPVTDGSKVTIETTMAGSKDYHPVIYATAPLTMRGKIRVTGPVGPSQVAGYEHQYIAGVVATANLTLDGITFTDIRHNPENGNPISGMQTGNAIVVSGASVTDVSITNCTIERFQKQGITLYTENANVQLSNNTIQGVGPVGDGMAAQNGIMIWGCADGSSISDNNISDIAYTGNSSAVGIYPYTDNVKGLTVSGNTLTNVQIPITPNTNGATVTDDGTNVIKNPIVVTDSEGETIASYIDLPSAVKAAPDGATISVYPGEYDIPFDETWTPDYPGASAGWYLPIEQNDLTIQGVDENGNPITDVSKVAATLYSTDLIDTGVWGRQNFVTIFGDNVTLTGLTIMNKFYPNKAMEIMGANATIQYCRFTPTPQEMWPEEAQAELDAWIDAYGNLGSLVYFNSPSSGGGAVTNCLFDRSSINLGGTGDGDFTITNNQFIGKNQYSTTTTYSTIGFPDAWGGNMDISEANILISNNSFENTGRINFSNVTNGTVDISENYWGGGMPADGQLSENVTIGSYYAVQNADGSLDNLITILEDQTDVTTALLLEQQTTDTSKVDVYLTGSDGAGVAALIENLVAVDITFAAADANPLAITSFTPANAEWTYEDYDNGRYLIHEKGMELGSADENGDKILLGTITLGGYGTFSIQATGTAQLRTDDGANTLIEKTCEAGALTVDVTKPQAVLTVNVDFNHNIAENNNADTNDFTITVKGMGMEPTEYRIGNDTGDPFVSYTKDGATFTLSLDKDVSYTVEIAGAGYRTFRQTILMDGDKTLNLWNNKFDAGYEVEVIEGDATTKRTDTFLAGDIVMDYTIGLYDLSAVVSYFGKTTADFADPAQITSYDLNRDGIIDSTDVAMVLVSWEEQ